MRTSNQILKIKKTIQDPYEVKNLLSSEEINSLIEMFNNQSSDNKIYKTPTQHQSRDTSLN
jgi:hypothetical protein